MYVYICMVMNGKHKLLFVSMINKKLIRPFYEKNCDANIYIAYKHISKFTSTFDINTSV